MGFQTAEAPWPLPSCLPPSSGAPWRHFAIASHFDRRDAPSPSCARSSWCRRATAAALPGASAIDSQHPVETFEDAGGNAGRLLVEPAGEIAQQPLGLVGIVELPGLAQRPLTEACKGLGSRSITLRALWNWQASARPGRGGDRKYRCGPGVMNSRQTVGLSPRSIRLSISRRVGAEGAADDLPPWRRRCSSQRRPDAAHASRRDECG